MPEPLEPMKWATERVHPRMPYDGAVSLITPEPNSTKLRGRSVDLSEDGISARLPTELAVGAVVQLEFRIPSEHDPITLRAVVRNRLISRYGFQFLAPSNSQVTVLHRFCETLRILQ